VTELMLLVLFWGTEKHYFKGCDVCVGQMSRSIELNWYYLYTLEFLMWLISFTGKLDSLVSLFFNWLCPCKQSNENYWSI